MTDPNLITSGLSQTITTEGHRLRVEIYRIETCPEWSLEIVDEDGTSTVWIDLFETDQAAFDEAQKTIGEEGLSAFRSSGNVVQFPKR